MDTLAFVRKLKVEGWTFVVEPGQIIDERDGDVRDVHFIKVMSWVWDSRNTDRRGMPKRRELSDVVRVEPYDTELSMCRKVLAVIQYLQDHELREQFIYDGVLPFDPHRVIDSTGRIAAHEHKQFYVDHHQAVMEWLDLYTPNPVKEQP